MIKSMVWAAAGAAVLLTLGGCGREADKASRAEVQSTGAAPEQAYGSSTRASYEADRQGATRPRQDAGPKSDDGKPAWASNRQHTGEENAERQFERNGKDFDAGSLADYEAKAHRFIDSPPKGVLSLARPNGDVLYYDAKANIFVVADRQGAPRTMFKPRDGMDYWTQQKDRAADQDSRAQDDAGRPRRRYNARTSDEDANG